MNTCADIIGTDKNAECENRARQQLLHAACCFDNDRPCESLPIDDCRAYGGTPGDSTDCEMECGESPEPESNLGGLRQGLSGMSMARSLGSPMVDARSRSRKRFRNANNGPMRPLGEQSRQHFTPLVDRECPPDWIFRNSSAPRCVEKQFVQDYGVPQGPILQRMSWEGVGMREPTLAPSPDMMPINPNPFPLAGGGGF